MTGSDLPSGDAAGTEWSYEEALEWLYGRQALGIKLGLGKMERLLAFIGDPHKRFRSVHVAGTNGKGSVTVLFAAVLQRAGYRVGRTISPHLVHFTERITVDGTDVDRDLVRRGLMVLRPHVAALDTEGEPPTFFEVVTALAFWCFAEAGVEWAVVETGMGGRLDATNVLQPEVTVITNVERDHAMFLGEHPAQVAFEKGGIMKPGVPCVTGCTGEALLVLKQISHERRVPMSILGEDYHVLPDLNGLRLAHPGGEAHYDVALPGAHQLQNAALVVSAADALRTRGVRLPERAVQEALAHTTMPGRLESFRFGADRFGAPGDPDTQVEVLLDGAHNVAAAHALRRHLAHRDWSGFHLITGFHKDKDWQALLEQWVPLAIHVWAVPLRSGARSLEPEALAAAVTDRPCSIAPDARSALTGAIREGATKIVVAGSLFLVGEVRAVLTGDTLEEVRGSQ